MRGLRVELQPASTFQLAWAIALAPAFAAATLGRLAHLARRRCGRWARHGALWRRRHGSGGLPLQLRLGAGLHLRLLRLLSLGLHLRALSLLRLDLHLRLLGLHLCLLSLLRLGLR